MLIHTCWRHPFGQARMASVHFHANVTHSPACEYANEMTSSFIYFARTLPSSLVTSHRGKESICRVTTSTAETHNRLGCWASWSTSCRFAPPLYTSTIMVYLQHTRKVIRLGYTTCFIRESWREVSSRSRQLAVFFLSPLKNNHFFESHIYWNVLRFVFFFLSFHYNVFPKKFTSHIQRDITSPQNTYVFPSLFLFSFTPKKKERQILIFFYLHIIQIRPIVRIVLISDQSGQHGAVGSEGRSNECQHVGIPQFTVPCSVDRSWIATLEPGEGGPEAQRIQHQTDRLEGHWKKMERD